MSVAASHPAVFQHSLAAALRNAARQTGNAARVILERPVFLLAPLEIRMRHRIDLKYREIRLRPQNFTHLVRMLFPTSGLDHKPRHAQRLPRTNIIQQ
jgi:hypothetical protein